MTAKTRDKLKAFIALNGIYIKDLAALMSQKGDKNYTEDSLGGKIRRESLTFKEAELMAEALGYKLEFIRK